MKKKLIGVIAVLVGLCILLFLLSCIPKNIDLHYPAVQYNRDEPSIVNHTTISMKGKLYKPLFLHPKYVGTCIIESYDFTKTYELIDITFDPHMINGLGVLSYTLEANDTSDLKMIGNIWMSGNMDSLCILGVSFKDVGINSVAESVIISAPAKTREEAIKITDQWRYPKEK